MKSVIAIVSIAAALVCTLPHAYGRDSNSLDGHWTLIREKSASIDPWNDLVLDIHIEGTHVTIVRRYSAGNALDRTADSMSVNTEGREEIVPAPRGRWLGEVSMGIYYGPKSERHVLARISDSGNLLQMETREMLQTAQGETEVEVKETFALSSDGSRIQWSESRSTRKAGPPLVYTFERMTR